MVSPWQTYFHVAQRRMLQVTLTTINTKEGAFEALCIVVVSCLLHNFLKYGEPVLEEVELCRVEMGPRNLRARGMRVGRGSEM